MQKILFDSENAKQIALQASNVCVVYEQIANTPLVKLDLLNAFAKVFGYQSGWAELMAVNKSRRYYVSFSMAVCSHMRAIIAELSRFLPLHVDSNLLLIAVSFTELKISKPNRNIRCQSEIKSESGASVLWFNETNNAAFRNLAKSPSAALLEREGIHFKHLATLWPELHYYLQQKCKLPSEQVLMFSRAVWCDYNDRFIANYQNSEIGQWEIHFKGKNLSERVCYDPIYEENREKISEELATSVSDGLSGCAAVERSGEDTTDEKYILRCLAYWKTLPHIRDIRFSLRKEHLCKLKPQFFDQLGDFLSEHNESMDFLKNRVTNMDFTGDVWGFEPRFIYSKDGSRRLYLEPWLVAKDVQSFIDTNTKIHACTLSFDQARLLEIDDILKIYRQERFSPTP